jgi:hypothetical protein
MDPWTTRVALRCPISPILSDYALSSVTSMRLKCLISELLLILLWDCSLSPVLPPRHRHDTSLFVVHLPVRL